MLRLQLCVLLLVHMILLVVVVHLAQPSSLRAASASSRMHLALWPLGHVAPQWASRSPPPPPPVQPCRPFRLAWRLLRLLVDRGLVRWRRQCW